MPDPEMIDITVDGEFIRALFRDERHRHAALLAALDTLEQEMRSAAQRRATELYWADRLKTLLRQHRERDDI